MPLSVRMLALLAPANLLMAFEQEWQAGRVVNVR
jgi:hypothetical protein